MLAKELLNSGAYVKSYSCSASSHFIGLLGKLVHEYLEKESKYGIEGEEIEEDEIKHIALYKNEILLFHKNGKVFTFNMKITVD